jgi:hypothetical protein
LAFRIVAKFRILEECVASFLLHIEFGWNASFNDANKMTRETVRMYVEFMIGFLVEIEGE